MTVLTVGKPITTDTPRLQVDNALPVGAHVFRLVVVDDDGLESDPFDATVRVIQVTGPPPPPPPPISTVTPTVPAATPVVPVAPSVTPVTPVARPVSPVAQPVKPVAQPAKPVVKPVTPMKPVIPPSGGKPT